MTDELQSDPNESPGVLTGWNLCAVLYLCLSFWCVIGSAVALFFRDWFALGWSLVAFSLAAALVYEKRGE